MVSFHTQHTSMGRVKHFALLVLKKLLFQFFYSHLYFGHFEILLDSHCIIHESFMFYHVCAFDITSLIILRGRKILLTFFFIVLCHTLRGRKILLTFFFIVLCHTLRGRIFFHDLAFHSLCIHSFDHVYVSLTFLGVTGVLLPFVHS
jgi:hypothetical protein